MISLNKIKKLSFFDIEKQAGTYQPFEEIKEEEGFPLVIWHRKIFKMPLGKFSVHDICRSCQQKFHLNYLVPLALELLEHNPLSGEMYDGQVYFSLESIPSLFWDFHPDERDKLFNLIKQNYHLFDEEIKKDVTSLLIKMKKDLSFGKGTKEGSPGTQ